MKALDLTAFNNVLWDITLLDGTVLHIEKPKQKLILEIADMQKKAMDIEAHPDNYTPEQALALSNDLVLKILNSNIEKKVFKKDYIEKNLNFAMIQAIIKGYMSFVQDVNSDPNL